MGLQLTGLKRTAFARLSLAVLCSGALLMPQADANVCGSYLSELAKQLAQYHKAGCSNGDKKLWSQDKRYHSSTCASLAKSGGASTLKTYQAQRAKDLQQCLAKGPSAPAKNAAAAKLNRPALNTQPPAAGNRPGKLPRLGGKPLPKLASPKFSKPPEPNDSEPNNPPRYQGAVPGSAGLSAATGVDTAAIQQIEERQMQFERLFAEVNEQRRREAAEAERRRQEAERREAERRAAEERARRDRAIAQAHGSAAANPYNNRAGDDCDDSNEHINPGMRDICDCIDEDCDGVADDNAPGCPTYYWNVDGDGWGDSSRTYKTCPTERARINGSGAGGFLSEYGGDCNDNAPTVRADCG